MDREKWLKGLKITVAAVFSITAAGALGLRYSATAGIITILSIQSTKRETVRTACRRGLAFLCALLLAGLSFRLLGFTIPAFAVYLFCFSCLCLFFDWTNAIAMDSVLITHFLAEGNMGPPLLGNGICLFVLGTGMGILANLYLRRKTALYNELAVKADARMRDALKQIGGQLLGCGSKQESERCLAELEKSLEELKDCAYRNWNNTFFGSSVYELEYARMRRRQKEVLKSICGGADMVESIPKQAVKVAELLGRIEAEYDRNNTAETLQESLRESLESLRREPLPKSREEFEARAVLFYLIRQMEEFLRLKREFICDSKSF